MHILLQFTNSFVLNKSFVLLVGQNFNTITVKSITSLTFIPQLRS